MINEYALDPELLKRWSTNERDYSEFMREYGLGTPRLISSFPKKKSSKLRSYFLSQAPGDPDSLQGRRYLEMVIKMVDSLILRIDHDATSGDWVKDTKDENDRIPFSVVLSSDAIDTPRNITPDNMYSADSIWNHPRQKNIQRTLEDLNNIAKDLLRLSANKVVIIDAYGWTAQAITALQSLIQLIRLDRVNGRMPDIYVYYKEKIDRHNSRNASPPADYLKQQVLDRIEDYQADINLKVFELQEIEGNDVFHNRCILTEHGGINLGHGIGVSDNDAHTDEASLMEKDIYEKKWAQFVESDDCFNIATQSG